MDNLIDLHTHTLLSTHAYSTIWENVKIAKEKGLKYYGISDHGPAITGGQHIFAVSNMRIIPDYIEGIRVLKSVEINIMNSEGDLDIPARLIKRLDYAIASFHVPVISDLTIDEVTNAYLKLCENKDITILAHIDDERFKCDYEAVVRKCKETGTLLEINNSSLKDISSRVNGPANIREILLLAKQYELPVIINSDAHICFEVGRYDLVVEVMKELGYPLNLVLNFNENLIEEYILKNNEQSM